MKSSPFLLLTFVIILSAGCQPGTPPQTPVPMTEPSNTPLPVSTSTSVPTLTAAAISPTPDPATLTWVQVEKGGLGDPDNMGVFALLPFGEYLYASTRNQIDGAQIWRIKDGAREQVIKNGFGNPKNVMIESLVEFKGYLYAGTVNGDLETYATDGAEIWRSADGKDWEPVVKSGFGNTSNAEIIHFAVYQNYLYAFTWSWTPGVGPEIWRSLTGDEGDWSQVVRNGLGDPINETVLSHAIYKGRLYAGTCNINGAQLWSTPDGVSWDTINSSGLGEKGEYCITALDVFQERLYAATYTASDNPEQDTTRVYRCTECNGKDWELVIGGGYDHGNTVRKPALEVYGNQLFLVTGNAEYGLEVWRTGNGEEWTQLVSSGFGNPDNEYTYFDNATTIFENSLFIGTNNRVTGAEIWKIQYQE